MHAFRFFTSLALAAVCTGLQGAQTLIVTLNTDANSTATTGTDFGNFTSVAAMDLRAAINYMNTNAGLAPYTVVFQLPGGSETITLQAPLPIININGIAQTTIDGSNNTGIGSGTPVTVSGANTYRGFFVRQASTASPVTIQNLTLLNCRATGGAGGLGSGGAGLGAGGGLFIDSGCTTTSSVILSNVGFSGCSAVGGTGGLFYSGGGPSVSGGGGGGMGGAIGSAAGGACGNSPTSGVSGGGGGGGLFGAGGAGAAGSFANSTPGGAGGGGGVLGAGGAGGVGNASGGGGCGGGGGITKAATGGAGGAGGASGTAGGSSGTLSGNVMGGGGGGGNGFGGAGAGGAGGGAGGTALSGNGGGGGSTGFTGANATAIVAGAGNVSGGGGGAVGLVDSSSGGNVSGGSGGTGGGGGGTNDDIATTGGYGGGGGGGGLQSKAGNGGRGGGGGGVGFHNSNLSAGTGGFGAGGGGGGFAPPNSGGFGAGGGGGNGTFGGAAGGQGGSDGGSGSGSGGSGAGLGGAIFVVSSANNALEIRGGTLSTLTGSSVTAGAAADGTVSAGAAASAAIHVMSGISLLLNPVLLADTLTINSAIGDDSSNTLPGPGYVAGSGAGSAITKTGAGTAILNGTNTYAGSAGTTIQAGTLQIASDAALGLNTIPLTFNTANGTLKAGGAVTSSRPISIASGITATFDTNGLAISESGAITGSGGALTVAGAGTLTFAGTSSNTYSGLTTVPVGTLTLNKTGGGIAISNAVTVSGGALTTSAANQFGASATMTLSSGSFTMGTNAQTLNSLTFQGGTLTQGVGGTLTLSNNGTALTMRNTTISGPVTLSGGASQAIVFDATNNGTATLSGDLNLSGNATLFNIANGSAASDMAASGIISNGSFTKMGSGTLTLSGASSNTYTGLTTVTAGTLELNKSGGAIAVPGNVAINGGTLSTLASNQFATTSSMTLSSGTFDLNSNAQVLNSLTFQAGTLTQGGTTLSLNNNGVALTMRDTTVSGNIILTGGSSQEIVFDTTNNGTATISGNLNMNSNPTTFTIPNGAAATDMVVSGVISMGSLTKAGNGVLSFAGAASNMYGGSTTVSNGTLTLNKSGGAIALVGNVAINGGTLSTLAANQFGAASSMTLSSGSFTMGGFAQTLNSLTFQAGTLTQGGAALTLNNNGTALTMRDTTLAGDLTLTGGASQAILFDTTNNGTATIGGNLNMSGNATLFTIPRGTASTDMLVSGNISAGSLTKAGSGILTLSGTNTYGATTITDGTLVVNGTQAGTVAVNLGALLKGSGTINNTVTVGGTIQAGNSIGTISIATLDLLPGSTLILEIAPGNSSSQYLVNNASLGGSTLSLLVNPGTYAASQMYNFIVASGAISGQFDPTILNVPSGFIPLVVYENQLTQLLLTNPQQIGTGVPLPPGQKAVLNYLTTLTGIGGMDIILSGLGFLDPDQLQAALNSISPARNQSAAEMAALASFRIREMTVNQLSFKRIQRLLSTQQNEGMTGALEIKRNTFLAMNDDFISLDPPESADSLGSIENTDNLEPPVEEESSPRSPAGMPRAIAAKTHESDLWASGFGMFISQDGQNQNPQLNNTAYGALAGYDFYDDWGIFSISGGYLHNRITEGGHSGSGDSDGGVLGMTATVYLPVNLYLEVGGMGSGNHFNMTRGVSYGGPLPFSGTMQSNFNVWEAVPHVGLGYDHVSENGQKVIEPFMNLDYAIVFQGTIDETGGVPLNMHTDSHTSSILRSQFGVNYYLLWENPTMMSVLELSGSYVNLKPFNTDMTNALVIAIPPPPGAASSFTVPTYGNVLHLGTIGVDFFYKHKPSNVFFSVVYEGEIGTSYVSNNVEGKVGVYF